MLVNKQRPGGLFIVQGNTLAMASPLIDKADRFVFADSGSDFDYIYEHDLAKDNSRLQSV